MLLPNFEAVCAYLQHPLLAERLLRVSNLASQHLENGVDPAVLFGKMHHCDFPKFHEAMSMFALAAHLNEDLEQRDAFLRGVRACRKSYLDEQVVDAFLKEDYKDGQAAIACISMILSNSALELSIDIITTDPID